MGAPFKQPAQAYGDDGKMPAGMCSQVSVVPDAPCNRVSFEAQGIRHEDLHCVPGAGDPVATPSVSGCLLARAPAAPVEFDRRGVAGSRRDVADARPGTGAVRDELDQTSVATNAYISQSEARTVNLPQHSHASTASATASRAAAQVHPVEQRQAWGIGSIVEVFSVTTQRWYVASIVQAAKSNGPDLLTVQFCRDGGPQMKQIFRTDAYLDVLGSHTAGEIPPGFQTLPSQSRPGQLVYLDTASNKKYSTVDLAWRLHFDRLLKNSPCGMAPSTNNPAPMQQSAAHGQPHEGHVQKPPNMTMTAYGPSPSTVTCG